MINTSHIRLEKNTRLCPICKIHFRRRGNRIAIYCSVNCKAISQKGKPAHNKGRFSGTFISCKTCGDKFYAHPKILGRRKYCSLFCRNNDKNWGARMKGQKNHSWKGGKTKIGEYIYIITPGHPNGHNRTERVAEHRLVMEKRLDRYLNSNEEVHHKNGLKTDNRIENLELVVKKMHFGNVRCPHCLNNFKIK